MQIAVLATPDSWYFRDLLRAAAERHTLIPLSYRQLCGGWLGGVRDAGRELRVVGEMRGQGLGARGQGGVERDAGRGTGDAGGMREAVKSQIFSGENSLLDFDALLVRSMPAGSLEQIVLRMDLLGELARQGRIIVNPPRALETAIDKFLTSARLAAAGLPIPRTWVAQTVAEALRGFDDLGRDVVLKPLFGSEGRGIARLTDADLAERAFQLQSQLGGVLYLQEFLPHQGGDYRILIIGQRHWAIRRHNAHDWRSNISRGGAAEPCELPEAWIDLAYRAAAAVGAEIAGVDLLTADNGQLYVIEVNAVPGWRGLAQACHVDIAGEIITYLASPPR
ncbi:MAG: RimK family alpha-L-glutamate ligase [Pirellulales bacterium]|nr:RimK family alpha-L-glutamate ligase [Pirellulales bacterium]